MTPTFRQFIAVAAVGALAVSAATVQAQPQGLGGPATQAGGPAAQGRQQPDLSAILHLRPDQQGAYRAFQAASQPRQDEIAQMRAASSQALTGMTTPQRLDRVGSRLNVQMQIFQRQAAATRAFYGQLSPDQQHTFDQVTAPPTGPGRPQG